ncbi:MAG: PAS domain S-box protein [Bdellovibrionales bacterium]|nr:PAS domain S-box protein [Bdellovibrionales bacterium]
MLKAPIPSDEQKRIDKLNEYQILDTLQEQELDEITKIAAQICDCRISLISLIDTHRQWFKSKYGLTTNETPRDISYCGHAIMSDEIFIVEDSALDERFCDNPLFLGEPHARFYAGAPLISTEGQRIGTLCVIDSDSKVLDEKQKLILKSLSQQIITIFEARKLLYEKQNNEFLLKEVQKNAQIGGWELNVKTFKTKWTDEVFRIHEVEIGAAFDVKDAMSFYSDVDRTRILGDIKNCIENGVPFESDFEFITAKGNKRWVHSKGFAKRDKEGKVQRILGTLQDITHKKLKEIELKSSKEYLDLALEGAGLGIWDWYLADNSVKFDERWAQMLGLDINEIDMELTTWESRVHPDDLEKCYADIKAYMDGKTEFYENVHRMRHKNGHWVYILDRGRFSDWDQDGRPIRFTGTHFDVSELEKAKQKLSLLYQNSPFGFAFCDINGNILDVNKKYEEITGYTADELKKLSRWDLTPTKYIDDENTHLESLRANGRYGPYRKEYKNKKGDLVPVELNGFIIKDFDGKAGVWSIVEDITQKIAQEKELLYQKQFAAHHAKLASIGELAAGVGHEINNPLSIVKGYLSVLEKKMEKGSVNQSEVQAYLGKIDVATNRIARIVQGLRTFSRSDATEVSDFSPIDAIEESFNMLNEIYEKDGIHLKFNNSVRGQYLIHGNRGKFQQIIMNLVSNAKDATQDKDLRIININIRNEVDKLIIEVDDNGCGFPESLKEKIFDPFFTTKEVNKGTGIGLSLVHSFIKEMNGGIRVESKVHEGSKFTLELPALLASQIQTQVQTPSPAEANGGVQYKANVILADDDEGIRELLGDLLESMGMRVTAVENGKEALDLYMKHPDNFDLIISDMKMPQLDGPSLLKKLRENEQLKQPKFIFITGGININFEDKDNELNKLIDGYLLKPFTESKVYEILERCQLVEKMRKVS